jgi:hypothetical protein
LPRNGSIQQKIGLILLQQIVANGLLIRCEPTDFMWQLADGCSDSFPRHRAAISYYDARFMQKRRPANRPHNG